MDILFFDKLITIIPIIVSILSAVISGKIYKINENSNKDREEREKIHEVSQIFPYVLDSEYRLNSVKVCNNSDYPIYDVMILEGINTSNIYAGENCCQAEYIRLIAPLEHVTIRVQNRGLGMCKFLVVGIFFRDYLGNEWFRDSYGTFKEAKGYKELLARKKLIFAPYSESRNIVDKRPYRN